MTTTTKNLSGKFTTVAEAIRWADAVMKAEGLELLLEEANVGDRWVESRFYAEDDVAVAAVEIIAERDDSPEPGSVLEVRFDFNC